MFHYLTVNTIAETICFLIAAACLAKDRSFVWRSMIFFLLCTCIAEFIGFYIKKLYLADRLHVHPNVWIYNILLIFQMSFISWFFHRIVIQIANIAKLILSGYILLITLYTYELISHGFFVYNNLTNTVMSVLFVLYCYLYFYYLLKDDRYVNLKHSPGFWWIGGALLYYFGRTACNVFFDILSQYRPDILITYPIYKILNVILYTFWSYSFISRKWSTSTLKVQFQ